MTTSDPNHPDNTRRESDDEVYVYAHKQLIHGHKPGDVRRSLIDAGHSAKQADKIVQYAVKYRNDHQEDGLAPSENQQRGKRNMWIGGGVFLLGLTATVFSIAMVADRGSGRIVLAYGAIAWGVVQFFRGVAQAKS